MMPIWVERNMEIQALASAHNLRLIPHVWGSGVALAAALQVCAALPLAPYTHRAVPAQNEPVIECVAITAGRASSPIVRSAVATPSPSASPHRAVSP